MPSPIPHDPLGVALSFCPLTFYLVSDVACDDDVWRDAVVSCHDLWCSSSGVLANHAWDAFDGELPQLLIRSIEYDPERTVRLGNLQRSTFVAVLESVSSLRQLNICFQRRIDEGRFLITIADTLPQLTSINVTSARVKSSWLPKFCARASIRQHLTRLVVDRTFVDDPDLACLTHLQNLALFHARHTHITDRGVKHIITARNLGDVALAGTGLTNEGLGSLASGLEYLHSLDVSHCVAISDIACLDSLGFLRSLNVGGTSITLECDQRIFSKASVLRHLDLSECLKVMDSAALRAVGHNPMLACLNAELLPRELSTTLAHSMNGHPRLTVVNFNFCHIGDDAMIPISTIRSLKSLLVIDCDLTDSGVACLMDHPSIEVLALSDNRGITVASVSAIVSMRNLTNVTYRLTAIPNMAIEKELGFIA